MNQMLELNEQIKRCEDGRNIKMWVLEDASQQNSPPILICPSFGHRMYHYSYLASNLALNGFKVYRYDPLNHNGLSDGEIANFTMSDGLYSLESVVNKILDETKYSSISIFASSLSARIAYQFASCSESLSILISAVGVVNLRKTLKNVFGEDYASGSLEEVPKSLTFLSHPINAQNFYLDAIENNWFSLDGTFKALGNCTNPIVNFMATDDDWVDNNEVVHAFSNYCLNHTLYELQESTHEISENPSIGRAFVTKVTEFFLRFNNVGENVSILKEIPFDFLISRSIFERRQYRTFLKSNLNTLN
jgi:pimeloyl-ACP methyl ester carboxylesterase